MSLQIHMATIIVNLPVRREQFDGKEHLVAPVVLLVEGVHTGSGGALFYPAEELAKFAAAWNGIPIPVNHPQENGEYVSANTPKLLEDYSVGRLFGVNFDDAKKRLVGEVWIDINKAKKSFPAILDTIQKGGQLEVSTGVFTDDDGTPGQWNGEDYTATVSHFRPDHLALLPGGKGACSWADGCGLRANVRGTARTPSFDGTESTSWADVTKTFAAYRDAYYASHGGKPDEVAGTVAAAPSAMKTWIASKTLLGEGSADKERDLLFFPVVNPKTGKLNEGALRAVLGGRGVQADIPDAAKTSAQNKARSLLNKHFDAELETNQKTNDGGVLDKFKTLFKNMAGHLGLTVQELSHEDIRAKLRGALDEISGKAWSNYIREVFDDYFIYEAENTTPVDISAVTGVTKLYQRGYSIDGTGQVTLGDNPQEVVEVTNYVPVGNADQDKQIGNNKPTEDENMKKDELIKALIDCPHNTLAANDEEWLKALSEEKLQAMRHIEKADPPKANDAMDPPKAKEGDKPKGNDGDAAADEAKRPETVEEYIANAPSEIQGMLRRSVARDQQIRDDLVKGLLANRRNKFTEGQLNAKDIDELQALADLAQIDVDYSLQGGGPKSNEDENTPPTPIPIFNREKKVEREEKTA